MPFLVLHQLSQVSVVFDFNASLNDVAPLFPMLFSVYLMKVENSDLLLDVICVLFLLSSPLRLSSVSVAFDFNASPNDVAPVSPIQFPVDLMRMEKSGLLMDAIYVLFLLSLQFRMSSVSAVFDFSASLSVVIPVSPMPLSVDFMKMEKS